MKRKVLFLDRDGVINIDKGFVSKIVDFELVPGIIDLAKYFTNDGYDLIIITNQSGIGRGYFTQTDFEILMAHLRCIFSSEGIEILDILFCPHLDEDLCNCRKPSSGMFETAIKKWNISLANALSIGDKRRDFEAARAAGIQHNFHYGSRKEMKNAGEQFYVIANLLDAIGIYESLGLSSGL